LEILFIKFAKVFKIRVEKKKSSKSFPIFLVQRMAKKFTQKPLERRSNSFLSRLKE
jgi:hypothetical protein